MRPQYQHNVTTSFALWADYFLLTKGEAYTNKTGTLYYYQDSRLSQQYKSFGSSYKQWVFDSAITGATIPSGVHVNGVFKGRNDGVVLDYLNGRALISGVSTGVAVTGSFAVKDFSIYLSNESEEDLILNSNSKLNEQLSIANTYVKPYDQSLPAIYIINEGFQNSPFAFGGEDETKSMIKCVVLANNQYNLDGVLSLFSDSQKTIFKEKDFTSYPISEYGDIKSPPYEFDDIYENPNSAMELFVDSVTVSKLKDARSSASNFRPYVGFMDFEIIKYRYPRS